MDAVAHQRVRGRASVAIGAGLRGLHQSGAAKVMLPKVHGPVPEVVFLNTAGGITGGDRLDYALTVEPAAQVVATTQTAERVYASAGGFGEVAVDLKVGAGARLDWLPQEVIAYEGGRLSRSLSVALAADATFLFVELLALGRHAMGEHLSDVILRDARDVRRDGRLIYAEPLEVTAGLLGFEGASGLRGAGAIASLGLFGADAPLLAEAARAVEMESVTAAVSGWDDKLIIRAHAGDSWPLRRYVAQVLHVLRGGAALPRVWQI
ncbi:urease accessory protein [Litoreibacter ponti]|uniref:Urease accessory protein UreD n=1 Tax=Litoreibacter ponti TaxID=1510457 RepID=A0A2T6BHV1_9RHOB|nr:urease accessory protein [Litoreibacter ponti]